MKQVIDGKVYNTETAEKIAGWSNDYTPSDFNYCEEALYRTKKGAWFLYGEGGARSKYSGNRSTYGHRITALTAEKARQWLEENQEIDLLEEHFADYLQEA